MWVSKQISVQIIEYHSKMLAFHLPNQTPPSFLLHTIRWHHLIDWIWIDYGHESALVQLKVFAKSSEINPYFLLNIVSSQSLWTNTVFVCTTLAHQLLALLYQFSFITNVSGFLKIRWKITWVFILLYW